MKKKIIALVAGASIFALVGCNSTLMLKEKYELIYSDSERAIPYSEIIDSAKLKRGYYILESNSKEQIVFIGMGQMPTLGYDLEVDSVVTEGKKIVINVNEIAPGKDVISGQALTYPYVLVKVNPSESIEIRNRDGKIYKKIGKQEIKDNIDTNTVENIDDNQNKENSSNNQSNENLIEEAKAETKIEKGVYIGLGDQNSAEVKIGNEYKIFRIELVKDKLALIDDETNVTIEYQIKNNQYIMTNIYE